MTKNTIKAEILRKLGFSSAPNVTGKYFSNLPVVQKQIEEVKNDFILHKIHVIFLACVKSAVMIHF